MKSFLRPLFSRVGKAHLPELSGPCGLVRKVLNSHHAEALRAESLTHRPARQVSRQVGECAQSISLRESFCTSEMTCSASLDTHDAADLGSMSLAAHQAIKEFYIEGGVAILSQDWGWSIPRPSTHQSQIILSSQLVRTLQQMMPPLVLKERR